jgi:hypothetical protein
MREVEKKDAQGGSSKDSNKASYEEQKKGKSIAESFEQSGKSNQVERTFSMTIKC